jgi:hypothetical protein
LAKLGRRKEAILAYEQALKLGLRGGKTLKRPIVTDKTESGSINLTTFARLASLYVEEGDTVKALNALKISVAGGGLNSMRLRVQLAHLYWEKGQWKDFGLLVWQLIKMAPRAIWAKSWWRNLQRALHLGDEV